MDTAYITHTGKIIEAEELWLMPHSPTEYNYACRGCYAPVIPCSYQSENKKRPYFRSKEKHNPDCDIDGERELINKGKQGQVSNQNSFPGRYPNSLQLKDERTEVEADSTDKQTLKPKQKTASTTSSTGGALQYRGHYIANTIRPICRFFINFPYDRHLRLKISGIEGESYKNIFTYLANGDPELYKKIKLYYACIKWKSITEHDDHLDAELLPKGKSESYKVRINWKNWSTSKRNYIKNELVAGTQEAIDAHQSTKRGWLFFIGNQDTENPHIFNIDDHRLMCYIVDEISYPKKKL